MISYHMISYYVISYDIIPYSMLYYALIAFFSVHLDDGPDQSPPSRAPAEDAALLPLQRPGRLIPVQQFTTGGRGGQVSGTIESCVFYPSSVAISLCCNSLLPYFTLSHLISPCFTSSYLTLFYLILLYLS